MAYGGPRELAEVEPFLRDVRGGRPTPPELVAEVRQRYAAIGGGSPLAAITAAQAAALETALANEGPGWRVFVGMRHWSPYIREAVAEIAAAGRRRVVALCLAPHYSRLSIGAYFAALDAAVAGCGAPLEVARVPRWGDHPGFLDAVAERVEAGLGRFAAAGDSSAEVTVLFTAHSLPAAIVAEGDPYEDELRRSAAAVAGRVESARGRPLPWGFCYQSAAAGARDWLGPPLERALADLAARGRRRVLVAPLGFVSDHVEVLYDVDVEAAARARRLGLELRRTASLNTSPRLVAALADLVRGAAARWDGPGMG